MNIDYAHAFSSIPPELATMLIAMIPIAELRVALPLALTTFSLPTLSAVFFAVLGNMIPVVFILLLLEPVVSWFRKTFHFMDRFFVWLFARTRHKFERQKARYGLMLGLVFFVAVPLPITGAWTGALAAYLFGISFWRALGAITSGVIIAAIIVLLITTGVKIIL